MTEPLEKIRANLKELQTDHRVKMTAWDEPEEELDEDGEVDEGCYFVYLLPGWSYNDGKELHHMVWSYSMPEMWRRMKTVEPCLCDKCSEPVKTT